MKNNIDYYDNMLTMLIPKSKVVAQKTGLPHRYKVIFATDCVWSGEIKILYKWTEEMRGNFYTKALQEVVLKKFRNLVLNMSD